MRCLQLLAVLAAAATPVAAQTAAPVKTAVETIIGTDVARHVGVIAHDSMMGRDTPSRGLELTAQYVADQFKKFGLKPSGDNGTWFQRWPVPSDSSSSASNTVGILEGTDPKLKHEYIVFTAHMDHVGFSRGRGGDSIYNGADDNASGTAGIIELAEAFSQPGVRPKRSLMFVTFGGEERGDRWGSSYFVAHPPVPLQQIALNFNFDVIGRGWLDSTLSPIYVTGLTFSDIGATVARVHAAHPELPIAVRAKDIMSSDHATFARKGVPILRFRGGQSPDEHAVTDSPDKMNPDLEAALLRLAFYVGYDVANADQRPQWDEASYQKFTGRPYQATPAR